jgi:hypothetical protein
MEPPKLIRTINNTKWHFAKDEAIRLNIDKIKIQSNGEWSYYVEKDGVDYYSCTYKNDILIVKILI